MRLINLNKQAFSLIELSIAMAVMAILMTATLPVAVRIFEIKAGEKTALEMALIQDAARNYYANKNKWPDNLGQLQVEGYLNPTWQSLNPWGDPYLINNNAMSLTVVTGKVPANMQDMVISRLPLGQKSSASVFSSISAPGVTSTVARGVIVAWFGTLANKPDGWAICDGTQGTPDLRDKFIIGASVDDRGIAKTSVYNGLTQTGGNATHVFSGTTAEAGEHDHLTASGVSNGVFVRANPYGTAYVGSSSEGFIGFDGNYDNGGASYQAYKTSPSGAHRHTFTTDVKEDLPPYYALAYIMKL